MFKILFLLFILFIFITIYSFKKRIDGILDGLFPPKDRRSSDMDVEELIRCANCGTYVPKSQAVKKISFRNPPVYFCSEKCKKEYYNKRR